VTLWMRTYVQRGAKSNKNPTYEVSLVPVRDSFRREIQQNPTCAKSNKSNVTNGALAWCAGLNPGQEPNERGATLLVCS
jgi:hypothetical protein